MTIQIVRRQLRWLTIGLLLTSFSATARTADSQAVITFIQISDTHICNLNGYHPLFVKSRQHYGGGAPALLGFLKSKPTELDADYVVITGDLIDYFDAETSDGRTLATQVEQFYPIYQSSPVPIFLTLGNHDIATYWIRDEDGSVADSQLRAVEARAVWIRNLHCFQQGTYYFRDLLVGKRRFRLIFLDNGYSLNRGNSVLDSTQLDWLEYRVGETGNDPVVLFLHKYLPVGDKNGDGRFFGKAALDWPTDSSCEKGFLRILNENRNILAMFVGHGHKNVIETVDFPSGHRVVQSQTGAFAQDPNHWRLLRFQENEIVISLPGSTNAELSISLQEW